MGRLVRTVVAIGLLAAGCSSGADTETGAVTGASEADYSLCSDPAGSWTDLTGEDSTWRETALHVPWADDRGCAVRLDSVWHTFGDEHCGWGAVEFISFGLPVGTPYTGPEATPPGQDWEPMFFFNQGGAVDGYSPGEVVPVVDLPASAVDTGLRTSGGERLLVASDDSVLYVAFDDDARVFVQPDQEIACA